MREKDSWQPRVRWSALAHARVRWSQKRWRQFEKAFELCSDRIQWILPNWVCFECTHLCCDCQSSAYSQAYQEFPLGHPAKLKMLDHFTVVNRNVTSWRAWLNARNWMRGLPLPHRQCLSSMLVNFIYLISWSFTAKILICTFYGNKTVSCWE